MVQDPVALATVHVFPPGDEVTSYDVGACPPVGGVTVIVASSSPTATVGTPGKFGMRTLFVTESGVGTPNDAASAPVGL